MLWILIMSEEQSPSVTEYPAMSNSPPPTSTPSRNDGHPITSVHGDTNALTLLSEDSPNLHPNDVTSVDVPSGKQLESPPTRRQRNISFGSDLVSLSSSESEHEEEDMEMFQSADEESPVDQTSLDEPQESGVVVETSTQTTTDEESSDDWLKVERTSQPSQSVAIPVLDRSSSHEEQSSCVSSAKTIEVLSTSVYRDSSLLDNPISCSITSLEDNETDKFEGSETTTAGAGIISQLNQTEEVVSVARGGSPQTERTQPSPLLSQEEGTSLTEEVCDDVPGSDTQRRVSEVEEEGEVEGDSGRMSPYLMISKTGNVAKVTEFESPGLLFAKANSTKHDRDLLCPADEVAEDVLEGYQGGSPRGDGDDVVQSEEMDDGEAGTEQESYEVGLSVGVCPIDPGVLNDLEKRAKRIAADLSHVMGNLRNSLHAMSVCSKQSIQLHREAVDNLHSVVDANVKAMYVFMTKFEQLHKSLGPLQQIASQIQEVDMKLKVLERCFRTP